MQSTTECKLNKLLDEFLSPECKIKDDVYFNTLLSHIQNIQAQNADLLINWILKAVLQWENSGTPSSVLVASFLINVLSSVSCSEVFFETLQEKQIHNKLLRILNVMDPKTPSSLKLGYVRLFKAILNHQKGITWLLDQSIWKDILDINSNNITIYLNRETQQAMSELLRKTVMVNESFCATVVKKIIDPLIDTSAILNPDNEQSIEICEDKMFRSLRTTLSLINYILEDILSTADECDLKILKLFVNDFSLTKHVSVFLSIAHSSEFLYSTGKILIALGICNLLTEADHIELKNISQILHGILTILNRNLPKLCIDNVLKLSQSGFTYSKMLCAKKYQEKHTEGILYLENQLLSVQLLPLVMVSKTYLSKTFLNNENYVTQISTILEIDCKECIEFLSIWQDNLSKHLETHTAIKSLSYLMSSSKTFDKHNAATISKCFTMVINDLHNDIKELGNLKIPLHIVTFFTHILDALCVLYSEYDVFLDSPEPVALVNILKDILQLPIPSQITVKVMKLLNISLKKFSSTSVDSLLEHKNEFGALLFLKFSDDAWEVRDSTIELLTTLSKYTLFQTLILENDFTSTVLKLALYDSESFVRATALQCLNKMITVDVFWDHLNKNNDIIHYLIIKFKNETEGTVRKEMATVLCTIYSTNRLNDKTELLYDIMRVASDDLHWEVKMEALKFWDLVIKRSLRKQDLNNVYLKEELNDENLTIPNICHKLDAVLNELSQVGCLGALVVALQDECDIEVSKLAVTITQPFVEFLLANKISCSNKFEDDHSSLNADNKMSGEHINQVDATINDSKEDGIMNTDEQNSGSKNDLVSPDEFFRFVQQDFSCIIEERKRWLMGIDELESLLDDMLKKYQDHDDCDDDDDVNPMDCY